MSELESESTPTIEEMFKVLFMQQQRIYDVLLTMLYANHPVEAEKVDNIHNEFGFIGSLPFKESE